ncbi:trypsin-like peptidase domain-containing protein [Sinorhizobium meliloti]|uniref:trypsin-like peptidase domain-containing protein n=1 Tax=Rhizobium meliloti TaxID=382 RepID=UPI00299F0835|nr:trypsin-like serine protease [Sinorhizobium meliloti]
MLAVRTFTGMFLTLAICGSAYAQDALDLLSEKQIRTFSTRANPLLVAAILSNKVSLRQAGITSPLRLSHLMTQFATETGGLRRLDENLNYTADRLLTVFRKTIKTRAKAVELAGRPQVTANYVYGNKLGNCGRHTNDGWSYRGSGFIQLTGRDNFRARANELKLPLEANPDIVRQPREGLLAAMAYWSSRRVNTAADKDDARAVRVLVNGKAAVGYAESLLWLKRARLAFGAAQETEADGNELQHVAEVLQSLGLLDSSFESSTEGDKVVEALKTFQRERSLAETGRLDEETLYSLTDPLNWRAGAIEADPEGHATESCLETGLIFDLHGVASKLVVNSRSEESGLQPLGEKGSGELTPSSQLETVELERLNNAKPRYADYETGASTGKPDPNFVPFSVIDPDERELVSNTTESPVRAVVQITFVKPSNQAQYNCSGTMIAKNVVLTAAHCVHDGGPGGEWSDEIVVYPARNATQSPFGQCQSKAIFVLDGWMNPSPSTDKRLYDLAAIKLDCDVGEKTGWVEMTEISDSDGEVATTIRGYPCDKTPAGRMWVSRDRIRAYAARKLFYQNDTYGCMSGSGVLEPSGRLVAVHTNGLHGEEPWSSNNAGTRLTAGVVGQLRSWIEE